MNDSSPASCRLERGAIAQLVERVLCKHEVVGSIPSGSTTSQKALKRSQANEFSLRALGSAAS